MKDILLIVKASTDDEALEYVHMHIHESVSYETVTPEQDNHNNHRYIKLISPSKYVFEKVVEWFHESNQSIAPFPMGTLLYYSVLLGE